MRWTKDSRPRNNRQCAIKCGDAGMPTPASSQFRCEFCGRHFNSREELRSHAIECEGAKRSQARREHPNADAESTREWESTP